ncbi:MAG: RAD55 family ATPase [Candidatus Methanofastidiosia archaeon]
MDFGKGIVKQRFKAKEREFRDSLTSLSEKRFNGVLRFLGRKEGNLLLLKGKIVALTYADRGGDEIVDLFIEDVSLGGEIEIHLLSEARVKTFLKRYTDVLGYPISKLQLATKPEKISSKQEQVQKTSSRKPKIPLRTIEIGKRVSQIKKMKVKGGWVAVGLSEKYPLPQKTCMNILIMGDPNPYKQLWSQQFLYGELSGGRGGIYFNFNISPDEIRKNLERFKMGFEKFERKNRFLFIDCFPWRTKKSKEPFSAPIDKSSLMDFGLALSEASKHLDVKSGVVVFDSLSSLMIYFEPEQVIKFALNQASKLKEMEWTGLFIVERGVKDEKIENSLRFLLDGVLEVNTYKGNYPGEFKIDWIRGLVDKPISYYIDISKSGLKLISRGG